MTIRVLLVDDQDMVRAALRAVLDRREDLTVVGEAADGERAVEAAVRLRPDVVVMDVRMPGVNGVEATGRLLADWPDDAGPAPRVLVLTTFDLDEYVHAALRAGASGFLLKNSPAEEFAQAVRVVAAGEAMLAPSVTRRLIGVFTALPAGRAAAGPGAGAGAAAGDGAGRPSGRGRLDLLTERELDVLLLVARGHSNQRIATELGLTQANVKSRVNRILVRLGLENRVQAAILAHEAGLLTG
ncbi:response regulator transcription factor [Actinomadura oligospora]|uniref:response regulator transcription factor n=1 Tax=Actinomadura oligospora TaxID=111804 RepID=UPI00047B259C|nr:response regulator transcription factor [Actinomadura oligospora]